MKTLVDLIQEKLKINSKSKITNDISDWCIAVPYDDLIKEFDKEFKDYKFELTINEYIYIVQPKQLDKYIDNPKLFLFKIPDRFKDMDELISALKRKDIKVSELEDWAPEDD